MDWKALLGELVKVLGIFITFLPVIIFFIGLYLGFIIGAMAIVLPVMFGSLILLIPCNIIGKSLYKAGLAIEMKAKGVKSAEELRKSVDAVLALSKSSSKNVKKGKKKKRA
jgi:hypothetical protein